MKLDFTTYSTEELFEAFEIVDDLEYPENAMNIYLELLSRLNMNPTEVTTESLGYQNYDSHAWSLFVNLPFPLDILMYENDETEVLLQEKIARLNQLLEQNPVSLSAS